MSRRYVSGRPSFTGLATGIVSIATMEYWLPWLTAAWQFVFTLADRNTGVFL